MHIGLTQGLEQLQMCYHFYNCLLLVGFFGGCLCISLTVMTFYGVVGVGSAIFLSSVGIFGFARVLMRSLPTQIVDEEHIYFPINSGLISNNHKKDSEKLLCELAIDTWTLGKDKSKDNAVCARDSSCSICLQSFEIGQVIAVVSSCKHVYHSKCLQMWTKKSTTCPYCRQDMEKKKPREEESRNGERCRRVPGALGIFEGAFESIFDLAG